ncbi:hypothetical protein L249_6137 [Ophiocordyceps polyrhachis-furcata BCC 54312]|uniref:Asl1-like glycosyl hydrolase catalytic domain-containing protein n=1 Tax=Ophiocordyceps polyrhachis-furcata BCC 54312 TaxID=1330021 RepID=A0A367LIN6_9HYPO|nr:hypothetical protein L249_6137 [Ophiocordyceps polyrhachis-furcata BCC 54312]
MFVNKIVAIAALAALTEQALAFNSHHHLHRRRIGAPKHTRWVTYVTTVTVDPPQQPGYSKPTPAPAHSRPKAHKAVAAAPAPPPVRNAAEAVAPPPVPKPVASLLQPVASYLPPLVQPPSPVKPSYGGKAHAGSGPVFSGKRGLAYNEATLANHFDDQCNGCSVWAYNWGSSPQGLAGNISYVPMLWGNKPMFIDHWQSDAQKAVDNGAKAMLSFNEPDNGGQAKMSPEQAAQLHVQHMNPWGGKALIGSPAVTNSGQPGEGLQWLEGFLKACDGRQEKCRVDFCVVHWYSQPQYADTLYDHIAKAHKLCGGKPVWLTEFGPVDAAGQPADAAAFLKEVIPKLDAIDYLHAYAPFMCSAGKLMSSANALSETGKVYAGLS